MSKNEKKPKYRVLEYNVLLNPTCRNDEKKYHVCNFGLAKQLKDLGVKQDGLFSWAHDPLWAKEPFIFLNGSDCDRDYDFIYSAFTVAELGEKLIDDPLAWGGIYFDGSHWVFSEIAPKKLRETKSDTEANARAKLLIYLIKNKLIDFDGLIMKYPVKK